MSLTVAGVQSLDVKIESEHLTLITAFKKSKLQKLNDFPEEIQALMPAGWHKSACIWEKVTFHLTRCMQPHNSLKLTYFELCTIGPFKKINIL